MQHWPTCQMAMSPCSSQLTSSQPKSTTQAPRLDWYDDPSESTGCVWWCSVAGAGSAAPAPGPLLAAAPALLLALPLVLLSLLALLLLSSLPFTPNTLHPHQAQQAMSREMMHA